MTVVHIVLFKFRPDVDPATRDSTLALLDGLCSIPFVKSVKYGENFSLRAKGYTHGLIVEVETKEQVQEYATHPLHVPVVSALRVVLEDSLAFDFENASLSSL